MSKPNHSVQDAFRQCEKLAQAHYENFPVASLFLPKRLRPYIAALYAFARTADDFADEGERTDAERLDALDDWQQQLHDCYEGKASHPIFIALAEVVKQKNIPKQILFDLLTAFRMDVTTHHYRTYDDLLYYCQHSANPIGRLVLHVFDDVSERNLQLSDNICTALQLANFWQDVRLDLLKGRIYIPLEDMSRFGYTEKALVARNADSRWMKLMKFEIERTRALFEAGKPLLKDAAPHLRFELTLTWNGGVTVLRKIERMSFDVLTQRPAITAVDKFSIFLKSFLRRTV